MLVITFSIIGLVILGLPGWEKIPREFNHTMCDHGELFIDDLFNMQSHVSALEFYRFGGTVHYVYNSVFETTMYRNNC